MKLLPIFPGGRSHFSLNFWASLNPAVNNKAGLTFSLVTCKHFGLQALTVVDTREDTGSKSGIINKPQHDKKSSLCTLQVAKDPTFLHADSEYSDQTG